MDGQGTFFYCGGNNGHWEEHRESVGHRVQEQCLQIMRVLASTERFRKQDEEHPAECTVTHNGSSGSMATAAETGIFCRSETPHNLRYIRFIGDVDTNSCLFLFFKYIS